MSNNFYNPYNPWMYNGAGVTNNTSGQINQGVNQAQTPGYAGFNNFQRPVTPAVIPGRMVANMDEITPQEVPMDGSISLFPQNDYSCIYAKAWTKEGNIQTVRYIPDPAQMGGEAPKTPLEERLDRIDQNLENLNRRLNKPRNNYQKRNNTHPKKETDVHE